MKNNLKCFAFLGITCLFLNTSFAQVKSTESKSEAAPKKVENVQPANAENLSKVGERSRTNPSNPSEKGKPVLKQVSKPGCSMKCQHGSAALTKNGKKEEAGCVPGKCQKACCAPKGKAEKVTPGS